MRGEAEIMPGIKVWQLKELDAQMHEAFLDLNEAFTAKRYEYVSEKGLAVTNWFRAHDARHATMKSMVEVCCPIVSYTGQAFEKLGKPEIAMDLYRYVIHRGCMGMLPFTRLAILLERAGDFTEAVGVCDKAMNNKWFSSPTAQGAKEEFSKRKARLKKKLARSTAIP
jgi:hypothetical protein